MCLLNGQLAEGIPGGGTSIDQGLGRWHILETSLVQNGRRAEMGGRSVVGGETAGLGESVDAPFLCLHYPSTNPLCYPKHPAFPATSSLPSQHESWHKPKAALKFPTQASGGGVRVGLPLPRRAYHSFHPVTTNEVEAVLKTPNKQALDQMASQVISPNTQERAPVLSNHSKASRRREGSQAHCTSPESS